jgi:hypothetical protein
MGQSARRGFLLGLPPFDPFPLGAKINDGAHAEKLNDSRR